MANNNKHPKAQSSINTSDTGAIIRQGYLNAIEDMNTSTIGKITSFNAEKQTATIQPLIRRLLYKDNGKSYEIVPADSPPLVNVPVRFPGSGGWSLTFPINEGDECLLIFTDKSIGLWKKYGGIQDQSHYKRSHSMRDAIAIVGLRSPADPLPQFNTDAPEIRSNDGSTKFTIKNGEVTFNGDINVTSGDVVADGISLKTHSHPAGGTLFGYSGFVITGETSGPT